ncbi:MAG: hypothetical protein MUC95_03260 [Spirochaetes bacterium]|nr:hypothetical protein [Spirochaetota bacterium]
MKKLFLILIIPLVLFAVNCIDSESYQYQPANPPYEIELLNYGADYLLLFRSENRSNIRFGGFFIFIDADPAVLTQDLNFDSMSSAERSAFLNQVDYKLEGKEYNPGRDRQIAILFSGDTNYISGSTVEIGETLYVITERLEKDKITAGSYLTLRTYLIENEEVMSVSPQGNLVLIEP